MNAKQLDEALSRRYSLLASLDIKVFLNDSPDQQVHLAASQLADIQRRRGQLMQEIMGLREARGTVRPGKPRQDIKLEQVRALRQQGLSWTKIGIKLKCKGDSCRKLYKANDYASILSRGLRKARDKNSISR